MKPVVISRDDPRAGRARPLIAIAAGTVVSGSAVEQIRALSALEEELRGRLEQAHREGQAAGLAEVVASCAELLARAGDEAERRVEGAGDEIIRLALAIASRVLHVVLETEPEHIRHLVEAMRSYYPPRTPLSLHAGARAYQVLRRAGVDAQEGIELVEEAESEAWSMRFETEGSVLDAGIEHQLRVLSTRLLGDDANTEEEAE